MNNKNNTTGLYLLLCILISNITLAQAPVAFNFQGVARDMSGNSLPEKMIGLEFSLVQQVADGVAVYTETHKVQTNGNGVFSVEIGRGTVQFGDIASVDWSKGPYFLKTALDETGGQNYRIVGSSELISVPYALYAENAGNATSKWEENDWGINYNNGNVGIGTDKPLEKLQISNGNLFIADSKDGMIMKSPDDKCWKLQVSNEGESIWSAINCPGTSPQNASMFIDPLKLVFDLLENKKTFTITNDGDQTFDWVISFPDEELTLSNINGTLEPGSSIEVVINLDRSNLLNGFSDYLLKLQTNIGLTAEINITVDNFVEEKLLIEGIVVDAVYDQNKDLLITAFEEPNRLDLYNTISETTNSLSLVKRPTCLAVSLDGEQIAVGHDGGFSLINTTTSSFEKYYDITTDVFDIEISGNGYVYAMPRRDQWEEVRIIELNTGEETLSTGNRSIRAGTVMKLHPSGDYIYGATPGGPTDFEKYDIRDGQLTYLYDSPYHGDFDFAGDLWISEDGFRLFARSRNIFRSSENRDIDMTYNGQLEGERYLQTLDHSVESGKIACVELSSTAWDGTPGKIVKVYEDQYLNLVEEIVLPPFLVPDGEGGGKIYESQGHYGYFNSTGTQYYVWVNAQSGSGLLNDWALVKLDIK